MRREWLVEVRKTKGLTQKEAAEIVGLVRSTYAHIEAGRSVTVPAAKAIGNHFGFNWTRFFEEEEAN